MQWATLGVSHCLRRWPPCKSAFELHLFQLHSGDRERERERDFLQQHHCRKTAHCFHISRHSKWVSSCPAFYLSTTVPAKQRLGRDNFATFLAPGWTPACVPSFQRSDWWLQPCRLAWIKCLDIIRHREADELLQTTGRSFGRWWPFTCTVFSSAARLIKTHSEKKNFGRCSPAHQRVFNINYQGVVPGGND